MTAVAIQHREQIIDQVAQGQKLTDIARSYGLSTHSAISNILADDPEFLKAREVGAHARMEARECELESADDNVTVARARELLSHARWRAEREFPQRWGAKQEIHHTGHITLDALLVAYDAAQSVAAPAIEQTAQRDDSKDNDAIGE